MTKEQVLELAACQMGIFTAVANGDRSEVRLQMEAGFYWIRKQIWRQVQSVMLDCDDPVKAANLGTSDIKMENRRIAFATLQHALIEGEKEQADDRKERWLHYVRWVEELINIEVSERVAKYIKISKKKRR